MSGHATATRELARTTRAGAGHRLAHLSTDPIARILFVACVYYVGARIGLLPALVRGQVSPFWPPSGIAVASLLMLGLRTWPGITIGAFAANLPLGPSVLAVTVIAAGNTLAPIASTLLLRRADFRLGITRLRDGLALIMLGALGGMLLSSTIGTLSLVVSGAEPASDFWSTWSVWWAGDAMGVLVVAPVLFVLPRLRQLRMHTEFSVWRLAELVVLLVGIETVAIVTTKHESPAMLVIAPMLVWAAVRFRQAGAAVAVLAVSLTAVHAASDGYGYFGHGDLLGRMLALQLFNGSAALTALLLAAAIAQRDESRRQLAEANRLLEGRVEERGAQLARDRSRIAVLADRHRIATELNDVVIQRLFGTGAQLEAMAATCSDPVARVRLDQVVEDLDVTINDLRTSIFQLDQDADAATLREAVAHVLGAASHSLGFQPNLTVHGAPERIPLPMRAQLLGTLQEVLTDIGHRAEANRADVDISVFDDEFIMRIRDTGNAPRHSEPHDGVHIAHARATRLGGSCDWQVDGASTVFEWRIPIRRTASRSVIPSAGSAPAAP